VGNLTGEGEAGKQEFYMEQVMEGSHGRLWSRAWRSGLVAVAMVIFATVLSFTTVRADEGGSKSTLSALEGIKLKSLAYLDYSYGKNALPNDADTSFNRFAITRGYVTLEKQFNSWMAMRVTMDVHRDETGDYKVREKYLYAALMPRDMGPFSHMKSEIGLSHIPWLDFEEHINPYRMQGTMPIERAGVYNSADLGISLQGNFGMPLADAKAKTGNSHYTGRYGSWHVGVYNGGGYHASEVNENKVPEWRFTVRPVPDAVPGLQFSYFGLHGKGNTVAGPDYNVYLGMASYENPTLLLTAQYFETEGNASGKWVTSSGRALKTRGFAFFGNVHLPTPENRLAAFARYDYFDADKDNMIADKTAYKMFIGGLSYDLYKGNMILVAVETTDYQQDSGGKGKIPVSGNNLGNEWKLQAVYQIKF
jgi:hypothetical protein